METSHIWRVDSLTIRINLGWWTGRWDKPFFLAKPIQVQSFFLQASLGRSSKGGKLSGSQIKLVNQVNLLNCGAQDQEKFGVKLSMRGGCPGRLAQWRWSLVFDHFHYPGHHHKPPNLLFLDPRGPLVKPSISTRSPVPSCPATIFPYFIDEL